MVGDWGYVTQLIRRDDLDVEKWQSFLDLCEQHSLIPIIRVATIWDTQNSWWTTPPQNANGGYQTVAIRYANFIAALDWSIFQPLVVVGNEPNRGDEWGGQPNHGQSFANGVICMDAMVSAVPNVFENIVAPP